MAEMTTKTGTANGVQDGHAHHDPLAQKLDSLHRTLAKIDEAIARGMVEVPLLHELVRLSDELASFVDKVAPDVRARFDDMLATLRALPRDLEAQLKKVESQLAKVGPSKEIASRPLFGVLPIARAVPQDLHSVLDYANAGGALMTAVFGGCAEAKIAGAALGASGATISALTDCRLSIAKVIPIEAHEAIDHAWGLAAIVAPFAFGYVKKSPGVAATHILLGATTILVSLFTDYRAAEGLGHEAHEAAPTRALAGSASAR